MPNFSFLGSLEMAQNYFPGGGGWVGGGWLGGGGNLSSAVLG